MDQRTFILETISNLYEVPASSESDERHIEAKRRKADQYLKDFQATDEAWTMCGSLLVDPNLGDKERLFACQTVRSKIIYDIHQLGGGEPVKALKQDLLYLLFASEIKDIEPSPHGLLRNIRIGHKLPNACYKYIILALVDLACVFDGWTDPVSEFMGITARATSTRLLDFALEFIKELPVELFENRFLHLDTAKADLRAKETLDPHAKAVFSFLLQSAEQQSHLKNEESCASILQALGSWLKASVFKIDWLPDSPLLTFAFTCLKNSVALEPAVDVLNLLVRKSAIFDVILVNYEAEDDRESADREPESREGNYTTNKLHLWQGFGARYHLPLVNILGYKLNECKSVFAQAISDEDDEWLTEFAQLCVEIGQCYKYLITESPADFVGFIENMLQLLSYGNLEIGILTVPFWDDFSYLIEKRLDTLQSKFSLVYEQLASTILKQCEFPPASKPFSAEELDEFRDFRHAIGNVLKMCVSVLGTDRSLALVQSYMAHFTVPTDQIRNVEAIYDGWQPLESAMFALRLMCSKVPPAENERIPALMDLILATSVRAVPVDAHPKLRYGATLVLGRYAEWTQQHPTYIPLQLDFISKGFEVNECQGACAQALKYLCDYCSMEMLPYLNQLNTFYAVVAQKLPKENRLDVTEALAHVLGAVPFDQLLPQLHIFSLPIVQRLDELSNAPKINLTNAVEAHQLVEQLSVIFKFVKSEDLDDDEEGSVLKEAKREHPCVRLLSDIFPVLTRLAEKYGVVDMLLYDSVCRVFRNSCKSFSSSLALQLQLVPPENTLLYCISRFLASRLSWVSHQLQTVPPEQLTIKFRAESNSLHIVEFAGGPLWLMQVLVDRFLSDGASDQQASHLVWALVTQSLGTMDAICAFVASSGLFYEAEYMLSDYFRLLRRCILQAPQLIASASDKHFSAGMFRSAIYSLKASNPIILEPLLQLLTNLSYLVASTSYGNSGCGLVAGFWDSAEALVDALLGGIFFHFPSEFVDSSSNIILCIVRPQLLPLSGFMNILKSFVALRLTEEGLFQGEQHEFYSKLEHYLRVPSAPNGELVITGNALRGNLPVNQVNNLSRLFSSVSSKVRARLMIIERK